MADFRFLVWVCLCLVVFFSIFVSHPVENIVYLEDLGTRKIPVNWRNRG